MRIQKIKTKKDALKYVEKVLNWQEFTRTHRLLKEALEILINKRK